MADDRLPENALASARQLWVLNRAGRIRLVNEELEPVSKTEADSAIRRSLAEASGGESDPNEYKLGYKAERLRSGCANRNRSPRPGGTQPS